MPFVGTGMHGDALGTKQLAVYRKPLYVRQTASTGITQSGYFVDVYTQFCHPFTLKFAAKLQQKLHICKFFALNFSVFAI
jgi:hypothetical protein